jgi:glycosyltransferase involved in cell wall biosynthesis
LAFYFIMLKIYFIDSFKPEKNHGLNTYTAQLGQGLANHQLNLTYVWLNAPFQKIEPFNIHFPKLAVKSPYEQDLSVAQFLAERVKGINSPIFHFNWINHLPIAHHLKKLSNCITVLTKHCIPWRDLVTNHYPSFYNINQAFEKGLNFQFKDPKIQREMMSYDSIDHIITVTECAKKSLTQLFKIEESKITKVSNGISPQEIRPSLNGKNRLREKYGFRTDEQLIVYAGNVNPRKGIFDVVGGLKGLLRKHPRLRLIIAGAGNYEGILKLAKDNWSRLTLCGSLDKQSLYDFYAMADMGIVPSYIEQCSYTCIEMMHSGLPIIVSDVDGLKEMVNNNCGLRIKVDFKKDNAELNKKDLVAKISDLLNHPEKAKLLAKNAKQYALQHFTAERMARETVAVYEKVSESKVESSRLKVGRTNNVPAVSIVIPCYNAEKYLQECLDSIYRQSFSDFEIILINDGSTDATEEIIKNQTDKRIVYLKEDVNEGVAISLNKAIALAKGKYIARMDADDIMHPDRLKEQVEFLGKNPDYGLVGSWHNVTDQNGMPMQRMEALENDEDIALSMLFYNPISHPTVMLRSELSKANSYNVEFNRCEDYELWFRLAEKTKLKNLPKALVNYRTHRQNTIVQHQKETQQNVMELLSNQLEKRGIEHSIDELVLHCAIGFGMGQRYFNSPERIASLHSWLDKVFANKTISSNYTKTQLKHFREQLLAICGMEEKAGILI